MPDTSTLLVVCAVCGATSAMIAAAKNRSVTGFFFVGFCLGLLGLIFTACVRSHRRPEGRASLAPGQVGPAGWFPDPGGSGGLRWFDGAQWGPQTIPPPHPVQRQHVPQPPPRPDFPVNTAPPQFRAKQPDSA